jgi:hypothetical protein
MPKSVGIREASTILNVSIDTVRRHIRQGKLKANKVRGRYDVELPEGIMQTAYATEQNDYVNALLERINSLENELEARRIEVQQLHSLLHQRALPGASWWQRLFRRGT